jgi:flagellar basal body-associated protein FliL
MATYQIPPDPRKDRSESPPHAQRVSGRAARPSPPWLWIGLGAIVTILAIAVAVLWARLFLDTQPAQSQPTLPPVINTATFAAPTASVATVVPLTPEPSAAPMTVVSTPAPQVTIETSAPAPGTFYIGAQVTVVNTSVGLNLRSEPVVNPSNIIQLIPDGTELTVSGGPQDAEGFTWWELVTEDGTEGWAVQDFIEAIEP